MSKHTVESQIIQMLNLDSVSSLNIEPVGDGYEVTVYQGGGINHSHHGGASLAEAVGRAFRIAKEIDEEKREMPATELVGSPTSGVAKDPTDG
jgi:hypothetical protein